MPREISRAVWFFIDLGGSVKGRVFDRKYHSSPIPRGGLEIILMVKFLIVEENCRFLDRLNNILEENYSMLFPPGVDIGEIPPEIEDSSDTG